MKDFEDFCSNSEEIFNESTLQYFNIFSDNSENSEEHLNNFPNEAYANLMALVLKNKLSNSVGNEIISFFNKHSNLSISPLPKNIQQDYTFMNNIKRPNLEFFKTCVLNYNNNEYFLYHWPLISCIKNILEILDISQNFLLNFETKYNTTEVFIFYKICLINKIFINIYFFILKRIYSEQNSGDW